MSEVFTARALHVWKFAAEEQSYGGYHFYLGAQSGALVLDKMGNDQRSKVPSERLLIELSPVTKKVLKLVNCRSNETKDFKKMKLHVCDRQDFVENGHCLEIKLREEDLQTLIEALTATQDGIGDFNIFDAQLGCGLLWMERKLKLEDTDGWSSDAGQDKGHRMPRRSFSIYPRAFSGLLKKSR